MKNSKVTEIQKPAKNDGGAGGGGGNTLKTVQ